MAKNRTLDELLRACTGFEPPAPVPRVSGFYPLRICADCEQLLLAAYEFRIKSIKSEKVLQNILSFFDDDNVDVDDQDLRYKRPDPVEIEPESVENSIKELAEDMVGIVDREEDVRQDASRPDVAFKAQLDDSVSTTIDTANTDTRQVPDAGERNGDGEEGFNNITDYYMCEQDTENLQEYANDNEEEDIEQENTHKDASSEGEATEEENAESEYSETPNDIDPQEAKVYKLNPFVCERCGARFTLSENLTKHKRIHDDDRRYECEHCGERFLHWTGRRYHIARVHTNEKRYTCEHCGKRFRQSSHYTIHARGHTGHLPYVCNQCKRGFKTAESLKLHQKVHTIRKDYRCEQCHKLYKTPKSLFVHQKTHRNQKDYVCQVCQRAFTQNHVLRNHYMKQHPGYEVPPAGTIVNATAIRRRERANGQQSVVDFEI
ncbi:zinc finger protein 287-like [Anopheles darlingi]|uniref:zinc finger protein 287-like n=1 Tax=Anopheles darlingi TaxID=43151 RepID=UPI0020FFFF2C|nr:zinc finger protein 287-like [Anopheles darlingi]